MDEDIVCSLWKHKAGVIPECVLAKHTEHKGCDVNSVLWNSGIDKDKETVRLRKRKTSFIANILVVSDKAHPENEGKVLKFKFGKKIFGMIERAMSPEFEDEEAFNPFDLEDGANFKIKIRRVDGQVNFDASTFDRTARSVSNADEILKQVQDLSGYHDPKKFKSYDDIKAKLEKHLGLSAARPARNQPGDGDDDLPKDEPKPQVRSARPAAKDEDADDDDDFFANLAND